MTKEDKQDEKPVSYEQQPDEDKPDYTPQRTYEQQSISREQTSDRRGFLKRTGTAVVVGLGGILFGKKALADGIDEIVGDEEGLKKVTDGYDKISQDRGGCYPERPCGPECSPNNENKSDFKKVTGDYDIKNCEPWCAPDCGVCDPCEPRCIPNCQPKTPCLPNCTPEPCHPNCTPD